MSLFTEDGTRVTKTSVPTTAQPDPLVTIDQDLYETEPFNSGDGKPGGSIRTLFCQAGTVMRQSAVDRLFQSPNVTALDPAEGPVAGTTVVTLKGSHLDGITAVTFGGAAGTALTVVSNFEVQVTTPQAPGAVAGPVDVKVTGDTGDVTLTGAYTYV